MKMNKVMRCQIIKPIGCDWQLFGKVMRTIQRETRTAMNKSMQICYNWQQFSSDYFEEHGEYPSLEKVHGYKMLSGFAYNEVKSKTPMMYTSNLTTSVSAACQKFKNDKIKILKGEMSLPSYKADLPIDLHNISINIFHNDSNGDYTAKLSLLSRSGIEAFEKIAKEQNKSEEEIKLSKFECLLEIKSNSQKSIMERCLNGEYKVCASQILHEKDNKWFLNLCYSFEVKPRELDQNRIMGIDLGAIHAAYMAFNFSNFKREIIKGDDVIRYKLRLAKDLDEAKTKRGYCGEGRIGHGRAKRVDVYDRYSNRASNYAGTINHGWSKYIVEIAAKNNCGVIQMEDLSGIDKDSRFLKSWIYFDLQQKIEYKAKEKGIETRKVNPKFTSQRCSRCGYIHNESRTGTQTFECVKCGLKINADFNAARNISIEGIDLIIETAIYLNELSKTRADYEAAYQDEANKADFDLEDFFKSKLYKKLVSFNKNLDEMKEKMRSQKYHMIDEDSKAQIASCKKIKFPIEPVAEKA